MPTQSGPLNHHTDTSNMKFPVLTTIEFKTTITRNWIQMYDNAIRKLIQGYESTTIVIKKINPQTPWKFSSLLLEQSYNPAEAMKTKKSINTSSSFSTSDWWWISTDLPQTPPRILLDGFLDVLDRGWSSKDAWIIGGKTWNSPPLSPMPGRLDPSKPLSRFFYT